MRTKIQNSNTNFTTFIGNRRNFSSQRFYIQTKTYLHLQENTSTFQLLTRKDSYFIRIANPPPGAKCTVKRVFSSA